MTGEVAAPKPTLTVVDAVALTVGIVVGAGIFETPALVAANLGNPSTVMLAWLLGGVVSLVGALCYAELATTYPHPGGDYHYLTRAFGLNIAFLFAWARMAVTQTGQIALFAFVFGDYVSQILPLGNYAASIYAALIVIVLTALNIVGVQQGKWTQNLLTLVEVLGSALVIVAGFVAANVNPPPAVTQAPTEGNAFGLAMVFVLLTYGGWNEAAYISAELRQVQRNMAKALIWSIAIVTGIYLLVNLAYLQGLGISGLADSQAIAADLVRRAVGEGGARFISLLVAITTLSSINATIITGARSNYALGQDFRPFTFLGRWSDRGGTPANALLVQGVIALALVLLGTLTRNGFETMVDYTAPVFWFFFLLSGISLLVLRVREPEVPRPFRVPFYPLVPILFCATCVYLLYSSLTYAGVGALVGVAVLISGALLLLIIRRWQS